MRAVDTNVVVRLIARDDRSQVVAAEEFIHEGAWVSTLAIAEAVWVLASVYALPPRSQAQAIEMLLNHNELVIQDAQTVTAALELFRFKPSFGFSDCLIVELAKQAGHLPVGTFDRGLSKIHGTQKL